MRWEPLLAVYFVFPSWLEPPGVSNALGGRGLLFLTMRASPPATNLTSKGPLDCRRHSAPAASPHCHLHDLRETATALLGPYCPLVTLSRQASDITDCLSRRGQAQGCRVPCLVSMLLARLRDLHESMSRANPPHRVTPPQDLQHRSRFSGSANAGPGGVASPISVSSPAGLLMSQ
ncbi:hypothetical protein K491DRAFT_326395 [Lophiostoma macrostomum CBS 122681]|uniref:Uncharacterized protein n=1 Tax=Lophiostoma macrostomum CBS 122681 TaxID=1314788 RepID=A0A6A6TET4_9PLEO|nr:hypothetical protein K491DRAFT_326395 [Lophiostoma macrostomum CBS 122681]